MTHGSQFFSVAAAQTRENLTSSVRPKRGIGGALLFCVLLAGCGGGSSDPSIPGDQANERLTITNTQFLLDARVVDLDQDIVIDGPPIAVPVLAPGAPPALRADSIGLTLVREIDPPIVDGEVVQANSIYMRSGSKAVVSYNMAGAPRLGAVDYFTKINNGKPKLSSSVSFIDSDINAVVTDANRVFAAAATNDPAYAFPAVLELFKITSNKLVLQDNDRAALNSFAATSATTTNTTVYATSGNTGEVFGFSKNDLSPLGSFPLNDARWVEWDKDGQRIVVAQGTPGQLSVFAADEFPGGSLNLLNSYSFPGANVPESKTSVEIAGGKAFVAAGTEGVQVLCLDDGQIIGSVPRPDPADLGLDPAVVVTNSVSVDNDLLFISNGEAGVYVAQGDENFSTSGCATQQITMLGKLRFDDLQSANHVAYKGDYLYVAAGLGGVKIIRVDSL